MYPTNNMFVFYHNSSKTIGGQNIRLPLTNRHRTVIDRLSTLPTYFGLVVNIDFYSESRFGSVVAISIFFFFSVNQTNNIE
jgi:uncharacterized membrane protein